MMQAGTYYIGDLCYVMSNEWNEFCKLTNSDSTVLEGEFELADGRKFAAYSTAYGDGTYPCSNGASLGVDAGLIGCILVQDIRGVEEKEINRLGTVVTFNAPFTTGEKDGVISFGDVTVDTAGDDPGADWEEEEDF